MWPSIAVVATESLMAMGRAMILRSLRDGLLMGGQTVARTYLPTLTNNERDATPRRLGHWSHFVSGFFPFEHQTPERLLLG
jgi:hypothetical protein